MHIHVYELFHLSAPVLFLIFLIVGIIFYIIGLIFLRIFAHQASRDVLTLPVAAFVGTIATAWALSLGFVAADIWTINSSADQAASEERSSISRLIGMAQPEALNAPALRDALEKYRRIVIDEEWGRDFNTRVSDGVEKKLQHIRVALIDLARRDVPGSLVGAMVQDFDELQDARNRRLAVGASSVNHYKWYLVLFLTLLTLVVIASTHSDRPKAGQKALLIFSVTAIVSMWILAIHTSPYLGAARLDPSVLFTSEKKH